MLINRILFSNVDHPRFPGISIYFQGCDINPKCTNCHNPQTWEFDDRYFVPYESLFQRIKKDLNLLFNVYDLVSLNFLGGEPLSKANRKAVKILSKDIKELFGTKVIILLYSWRKPIEIYEQGLLNYIEYVDEFVLGRYFEKYKNPNSFPVTKNQLYMSREEFDKAIKKLIKKNGGDLYANHIQL